jgi:molecular chaperone HtpG
MTTGKINVSVENIFPLIKKFLYSDHEIFLRELISNGTDATLKLKHLISIGEAKVEYGNPVIEIKVDNSVGCFVHAGFGLLMMLSISTVSFT